MPITPSEIEDRSEKAALTLRRLPHPPGSGPKGYGSSWPEYVHDARHAYGYDEARMRVVPSAQDIERMEECIEWLRLVEASEGRIIWLRAERVRWRQICIRMGCVRSTAWRRWAASLITIANHLNRHEKSRRSTSGAKATPARGVGKTASEALGRATDGAARRTSGATDATL